MSDDTRNEQPEDEARLIRWLPDDDEWPDDAERARRQAAYAAAREQAALDVHRDAHARALALIVAARVGDDTETLLRWRALVDDLLPVPAPEHPDRAAAERRRSEALALLLAFAQIGSRLASEAYGPGADEWLARAQKTAHHR